jgi:hypothetical protein
MHPARWFHEHLQASGEGFIWAVQQAPPARRELSPPMLSDDAPLGEWSVARHLFHMLHYEQVIALPRMRHWLGEPVPSEGPDDEEEPWDANLAVDDMLSRFRAVRAEQIALLPRFDDGAWQELRDLGGWGRVSLNWVVSKTYQHTTEHTSDVLRIALFWDILAERLRQRETETTGSA